MARIGKKRPGAFRFRENKKKSPLAHEARGLGKGGAAIGRRKKTNKTGGGKESSEPKRFALEKKPPRSEWRERRKRC